MICGGGGLNGIKILAVGSWSHIPISDGKVSILYNVDTIMLKQYSFSTQMNMASTDSSREVRGNCGDDLVRPVKVYGTVLVILKYLQINAITYQ